MSNLHIGNLNNPEASVYHEGVHTIPVITTYSNQIDNIKEAMINVIDYLSLKSTLSKEDKITQLERAVHQLQIEIHKIRESRGGRRRTHKKSHRNKRRHTRARK